MGLLCNSTNEGFFKSLMRRKKFNSNSDSNCESSPQLAKELSLYHLIAIGVGSTIGAGVYIIVGTVARESSGPSLTVSFLVAGIAAALSALCYAELAGRCPSAGSAYHYSYLCIGEGVAWLIGWGLILEYGISAAAVGRGISPNLALLFGGVDSLPSILGRHFIPWLGIVVDPCAAVLVLIVTGLLCLGIKESTVAQGIVTIVNICVMIFVIIAGCYLGFKTGWPGYQLPTGYFPYGLDGMLAGSATVFFAYIGFDSVASAAEEVKNTRDLPLGIAASLSICCSLYMLVSIVIVGLVPYYAMDPDTPISIAFSSLGMGWAANIITGGAITALCATLMGAMLPQPRIFMAMARDGLLPPFFSHVNKTTQVPVKSTVMTGIVAASLAFLMDVSQLSGMVSVGTLLAFTVVAVSILILRYVPPAEVPIPLSLEESVDSVMQQDINVRKSNSVLEDPLIEKGVSQGIPNICKRRGIASFTIMFTCIGAFILAYAASDLSLFPRFSRLLFCGVGGAILLCCLLTLTCMAQDSARHSFGHAGGFSCPFVPLLPISSILINVYLMINLGTDTWIRVSVWLIIGVIVYVFYGRTHSSLRTTVYVCAVHNE